MKICSGFGRFLEKFYSIIVGKKNHRSWPSLCSVWTGNKGRSGGDEAKNISNRSRFNESTVEGEAARIVQYYYKRWKLHSLFQQLILYRAEKMKQLVYFSQQVTWNYLLTMNFIVKIICYNEVIILCLPSKLYHQFEITYCKQYQTFIYRADEATLIFQSAGNLKLLTVNMI